MSWFKSDIILLLSTFNSLRSLDTVSQIFLISSSSLETKFRLSFISTNMFATFCSVRHIVSNVLIS